MAKLSSGSVEVSLVGVPLDFPPVSAMSRFFYPPTMGHPKRQLLFYPVGLIRLVPRKRLRGSEQDQVFGASQPVFYSPPRSADAGMLVMSRKTRMARHASHGFARLSKPRCKAAAILSSGSLR